MSKGHHGSGPKVVKAPDPEMKNIEQSNALATQKQKQGLLSTLMGMREVQQPEDHTNAFAFTGNEYANKRDEYIATVAKPKRGNAWEGAKTAAKIVSGTGAVGGALGSSSVAKILTNAVGLGAVAGAVKYFDNKRKIDKAYHKAKKAYNAGLEEATNGIFERETNSPKDVNNVQGSRKKSKSTATSDLLGDTNGQ